ncbi:hypothetical protein F4703DRAFT_1533471 [Phycomyces blakesleeanus]
MPLFCSSPSSSFSLLCTYFIAVYGTSIFLQLVISLKSLNPFFAFFFIKKICHFFYFILPFLYYSSINLIIAL